MVLLAQEELEREWDNMTRHRSETIHEENDDYDDEDGQTVYTDRRQTVYYPQRQTFNRQRQTFNSDRRQRVYYPERQAFNSDRRQTVNYAGVSDNDDDEADDATTFRGDYDDVDRAAATVIQSNYRGYRTRKHMAGRRQ